MKYEGNTLRHELKYYINSNVYHTLRSRLDTVIGRDKNMETQEGYLITSVYFDDIYSNAVKQKISGARFRKKFRLRSYNRSDGLIKLECKLKYDEYISKTSATLTREEYDRILAGDYDFLLTRPEAVCRELAAYHRTRLMHPSVAVEYMREAYVSRAGNVRVTFDKDISASTGNIDMFDADFTTSKVLENERMVMEVKYDDYLPDYIRQLLMTAMTDKCAISKYVMCREQKRKVKHI